MSRVFGLEVDDLPESYQTLNAFVVLECLDESGHTALVTVSSPGLTSWSAIGLLTAALDSQRSETQDGFIPGTDEEDDDE